MAAAKGIRINELAKELGVESKSIIAKLHDEGIADAPTNHQARISLGLAESVREWFVHSGGGTAVEVAPPVVEAPPKAKKAPSKKKKKVETEVAEAAPVEAKEKAAEPKKSVTRKAPPKAPAVETAPSAPVSAPVTAIPAPTAQPVVEKPQPPTPAIQPSAPTPAESPAQPAPAPAAPSIAAIAAPTAPPAPHTRPSHGGQTAPKLRETITLANRSQIAQPERKPVTPAPQLVRPKPAEVRGPQLIREEKPEVVPAPRPRGPRVNEPPQQQFTTARPATGRGVKIDDDEETETKKSAAKKNSSLSARRRGVDGRRGEAMEKLREFTEADLIARRDALNAASATRRAVDRHLTKVEQRGTHQQARTALQKGEPIEVEEPITVKSLSAALGVKSNDIIAKLMKQGIFATVNQALDTDTAGAIALEYGIELKTRVKPTLEEELLAEFNARQAATAPAELSPRPPVVTILGHVDHGKTSLLDKIRKANVAAGEAGGITQHTAAWMVEIDGSDEKGGGKKKRVTFIDTPGHHAFTGMRARGANMTDVVVLVVGAVEGVMPQTIESINHARAAGVPIVVALNKIDRADANPDMVLGQLAQQNLNPVEWGGDTEVIRTSAVTGQGINDLIETLDLQSQLLELKADRNAPARGTVIESKIDPGLGSVATVLVQDGTLKVGDVMLSGPGFGRIRQLLDDMGKPIKEAGPSTPVIVSGLNNLPAAGDKFFVVDDIDRARAIAEERATLSRQNQLAGMNRVTNADNLIETIKAGDVQTINLIIKADVQGSIETLTQSVTDQNTEEVKVRVIHSGVGPINESDVQLAMATKAKPTDNRVAIIGFHVTIEDSARALAEQNHIDVKLYRVIYEIFDDLKKALSGMLTPEEREKLHGHAEVRQVFKFQKRNIAGCMVTDGHIQRGSKIRLIRDGTIVAEDLSIETLRRVKDDVKEVKSGFECGIKLANYDDIKIGDVFEAYVRETFERTL